MSLYFITGSASKLSEVKVILKDAEQLDIDLPEIQDIDAHNIIRAKLDEARKHHEGNFIVEDTSLCFDALNGLPGPLIKWFMKTIGNDGLYKIAESFGNFGAEAKTIIGYSNGDTVEFFEGVTRGSIVKPRGEKGFGWDPVFQPANTNKTFGELEADEKNAFSMRKIATEKLREFISK